MLEREILQPQADDDEAIYGIRYLGKYRFLSGPLIGPVDYRLIRPPFETESCSCEEPEIFR